jgi:glycosyltransferase involved in cell wall biosynthesis
LFVLHSAEESQGIVFCEAMAVGKPIIATNVGGIPFVVDNNITGLLSGYGDITSFAQNILSILDDSSKRKFMSENCRINSRPYDWDLITSKIITLYLL